MYRERGIRDFFNDKDENGACVCVRGGVIMVEGGRKKKEYGRVERW